MNRRNFLRYTAAGVVTMLPTSFTSLKAKNMNMNAAKELSDHLLESIDFTDVNLSYPRLVGKNAKLGIHGHGPSMTICRLTTNQGASGIGMMRGSRKGTRDI